MRIKITLTISREFELKDPEHPVLGVEAYKASVLEDPIVFVDSADAVLSATVETING